MALADKPNVYINGRTATAGSLAKHTVAFTDSKNNKLTTN